MQTQNPDLNTRNHAQDQDPRKPDAPDRDTTAQTPASIGELRLIKADKASWKRAWVNRMIMYYLRKGFHRILSQGLETTRDDLRREPGGVLFVANHSNWWDFFLAHLVNETLPVDGYGMTDHSNMVKFGMFRHIGAYSVERSSPGAIRASIAYTAELLQRPNAGVWIFPQGKILCNDVRPLTFQPGLRLIAQRAGELRVIPIALRYEFWQEQHPYAFVRFGPPFRLTSQDRAHVLTTCQERLTAELDALRTDAITQDVSRFDKLPILTGPISVHDRFTHFRTRARGLFFRS